MLRIRGGSNNFRTTCNWFLIPSKPKLTRNNLKPNRPEQKTPNNAATPNKLHYIWCIVMLCLQNRLIWLKAVIRLTWCLWILKAVMTDAAWQFFFFFFFLFFSHFFPVLLGGGGGFFLTCEDFGRIFDNSFPACTFFFFFKVEISSCVLIPLFRPGSVHSGLASWDNCDRVFPDELRVSSFPDRFSHSTWTAA